MCRFGWTSILCLTGLVAAASGAERTWTNTAGRTMKAEFVREVDGEVTFLKDGQLVTIPLTTLSERDQQIVRDLAAGKPAPEEPAVSAPAASSPAAASAPAASSPATPAAPNPAAPAGERKPLPIVNRVWTDRFGNQTTAKFVRMHGGNVVLTRANKTISLPYYDLTSEDQEHLRELLTSRDQEAQIPPPPPKPVEPPPDQSPAPRPAPAGPPPGAFQPPGFTPPSFPPPSFPSPPSFGGGNSRMDEFRQQAEQRHQEFLQKIEQDRQEREQRAAEGRQKYQEEQERRRQEQEAARQNEIVGECLSCKGKLTRAQTDLDNCPHCGITWEFEVDSFGHKRRIYNPTAGGSTSTPGAASVPTSSSPPVQLDQATVAKARQFFIIGVVVVGVLGMFAVVVFVAITIAAASGAARRQRNFS